MPPRRFLTVTPQPHNPLDSQLSRLLDLRPAWRKSAEAVREIVLEEIDREWWRPPSGAPRPWPKRKPFGSRSLPAKVFGRDYRAAWAGGAGSVLDIKADTMSVGIDAGRFPWIEHHRPGLGPLRVADVGRVAFRVSYLRQVNPWRLAKGSERRRGAQRYAIWWYLFRSYGVRLKDETLARGLEIPPRPHATVNPLMRTRITGILARHVADGD